MISKFRTTRTCPSTPKTITTFTFGISAFLCISIVLLIRMLAQTLKIVGSMGRYVIKTFAFAFIGFTERFFSFWIQILMFFKSVVAKTFGFWPNHLTLNSLLIPPTKIQPILTFLRNWQSSIHDIQLFKLLQVFFRNHCPQQLKQLFIMSQKGILQYLFWLYIRQCMKTQKRRFTIIAQVNSSQLTFQVPHNWSINKLKCLLCSEIPALDFDQFQLSHKGQLLRGNHRLQQIQQHEGLQPTINVQIVKMKSQITFKQVYGRNVGKFMKATEYYNQPIMSNEYSKYHALVQKPKDNAEDDIDDVDVALAVQQEEDPQNQLPMLFRILRMLGIYLMITLVAQYAKMYQICIILFVVFLFYASEIYRKYNQRRILREIRILERRRRIQGGQQAGAPAPPQNIHNTQNQKLINVKQNNLKGLLYLYGFKIAQIAYTFCFTMFPNMDIQIYIINNADRIRHAKQLINRLRPGTYAGNQDPSLDQQIQERPDARAA